MDSYVLVRYAYWPHGTYGILFGEHFDLYTVERPWQNNEPSVSCIPLGKYPLRQRRYNKGGYDTYEVCDVPDRTHILIHKGNVPTDVEGCIALGRRQGLLEDTWAVADSAMAFEDLREAAVEDGAWPDAEIEIRNAVIGEEGLI